MQSIFINKDIFWPVHLKSFRNGQKERIVQLDSFFVLFPIEFSGNFFDFVWTSKNAKTSLKLIWKSSFLLCMQVQGFKKERKIPSDSFFRALSNGVLEGFFRLRVNLEKRKNIVEIFEIIIKNYIENI